MTVNEISLESLMREMKADLLPRAHTRDSWKFFFKKIPTIRSCKLDLNRIKALLAIAGIKLRFKPNKKFKEEITHR